MSDKDLEFRRLAKLLSDHLGRDAISLVEQEADNSREDGNFEWCTMWLKIKCLIEELVLDRGPDNDTLH